MRGALRAALVVVILLWSAPGCTKESGEASESAIESVYNQMVEAWEREDLEAAAAVFTPDAVVYDPVPPGKFEGPEGIRGWISGSFETLDRIKIRTSELRIVTSGMVAWATGRYVFEALQDGKPLSVEGYMSMVWRRQQDGSHKLAVFHASHLPPAAAP